MFIVFDGIDGAGKTTQVRLIEKWFLSKKIDFLMIREPGGCDNAEKIRSILLKNEMQPLSQLLLFSAARFELLKTIESDKRLILCDRFVDSTYAYQGMFLDPEIIDFLVHKTVIRHPDYVFLFLHKYKSIEEDYLEKVAEVRQSILIQNFKSRIKKNYYIVPNDSIENQHNFIKNVIKDLLKISR